MKIRRNGILLILLLFWANVSFAQVRNSAPYFTVTLSDTILQEDHYWGVWLEATDPDGDVLTWSLLPGYPSGMTINESVGTLAWTPVNDDVGTHTISASVTDGFLSDTLTFRLHVRNTNDPPEIISTPITTVHEDYPYLSWVVVNDVDVGDHFTLSLVNPPEGMTTTVINSDSGKVEWSPDNADVGSYNITVVVTDDSSSTDTLSYTLTVINERGVFTTLNPTSSILEDQTYSYDLNSTDEGVGSTAYSFMQSTPWLSLDPSTGVLTGTPDNSYVGVYSISVLVNDGYDGKDTLAFSIEVINDPVQFTNTPTTSIQEDESYGFNLESDDEGSGGTFYAITQNPGWLSINPTNGFLSGTPDNSYVGNNDLQVIVNDTKGGIDTLDVTINVTNKKPTITTTVLENAIEDSSYTGNINADDEGQGETRYYFLTSLQTPPAWLTLDSLTGEVSGTPDNSHVGTNSFTVEFWDGHDGRDTVQISFNVENSKPIITTLLYPDSIAEDALYNYRFQSTDDGQGVVNYHSIHLPDYLTLNLTTGLLIGTPDNADVGLDSVILYVDDGNGGRDTVKYHLQVINTAPQLESTPVTSVTEDSEYNYNVNFDDEGLGGSVYSWDISPVPGWLSLNSSTGEITGTPTNSEVGTHQIKVKIDDGNGITVVHSYNLTVVNRPPFFTTVNDTTIQEDSTLTIDIQTDDEGNPSVTYEVIAPEDDITINSTTGVLNYTPDNSHLPSQTIKVRAVDDYGGADTLNFTVTIINSPPVITGYTVSPSVSITDDTLSLQEDRTYQIDFNATDEGEGAGASYNVIHSPAWLTLSNDTTGVFSGTPDNGDVGLDYLQVTFVDGNGGSAQKKIYLKVSNVPPIFTVSAVVDTALEDHTYTFDLGSTDEGAGSVTYSIVSGDPGWFTLDNSTGVITSITGRPNNDDVSSGDLVSFEVDDGNGGKDTIDILFVVKNLNDPPVWSSVPSGVVSVDEDASYSVTISATDVDAGDHLTYQLVNPPSGMSINSTTGEITWIPDNSQVGDNLISVKVSDDSSASITSSWTVRVNNQPAPIQSLTTSSFSPSGAVSAVNDTFYIYEDTTYIIDLSSPDEDVGNSATVKYSFDDFGNPSWVDLTDDTLGLIALTPGNSDVGLDTVKVLFSDQPGSNDTMTFFLRVQNVPPVITTTGSFTAIEDQAFTDTIKCSDDGDGTITYSFNGSHPAWLLLSSNGILSGTPTNDDVIELGNFTITVDDGNGGNDSKTFSYTVKNVNDPPVWTTVPSGTVNQNEDQDYSTTVIASDPDAGDQLHYFLLSYPEGMTINQTTGAIQWTPDNSSVGLHTIVVAAVDDSSDTVKASWSLQVQNVHSNINPVQVSDFSPSGSVTLAGGFFQIYEDTSYTLNLTNSDEGVGSASTVKYSLGTFSNPDWITLTDEIQGILSLEPDNSDVGKDSLKVYFTDYPGSRDTITIYLEVINVPPVITNTDNIIAIEDQPYGDTLKCTDDGAGTITWSFISGKPSWLNLESSTGILSGTPTNDDVISDGSFTIQVTDGNGGSDSHTYSYQVQNVNDPPVWDNLVGSSTINEDSLYQVTLSASDVDAGETLTYALAVAPNGATINSSTGVISWRPDNSNHGTNNFTARVTDASGSNISQNWSVTVVNSPPAFDQPQVSDFTPFSTVTLNVDTFYIREDSTYLLDLQTNDEDQGLSSSVRYLLPEALNPGWATLQDDTLGIVRLSPENDHVGLDSLVAVFTDYPGSYDTLKIYLRVENTPPIILTTDDFNAIEDQEFRDTLRSTEGNSARVTWSFVTGKPSWLSLESNTGILSGVPGNSDVISSGNFTIKVQDGNGGEDTRVFNYSVSNVNDPPVWVNTPGDSTILEDSLYSFSLIASDQDAGDNISYSLVIYPVGMSINASTGALSWTPDNSDVGSHLVKVKAVDDSGSTIYTQWTLNVQNRLDSIQEVTIDDFSPSGFVTQEADTFHILEDTVYVLDLDNPDEGVGTSVYYSLEGLGNPDWVTLVDVDSGKLQLSPANKDVGLTPIKIVFSDQPGSNDTFQVYLRVTNVTPELYTAGPFTVQEDSYFEYDLSSSDEGSGSVSYSFLPGYPSWLNIVSTTGLIYGTPSNDDVGVVIFGVQVDDGNGGTDSQNYQITVINTNDPPELTAISDTTIQEDALFIYDIQAVDNDDGDTVRFSLEAYPEGMEIDSVTGRLRWTPDNTDVGSHVVRVRATDLSNSYNEISFTIQVSNRVPVFSTIPDSIVVEDHQYSEDIDCDDEGQGATFYYPVVFPHWLTLNDPSKGIISGTPDNAAVGDTIIALGVDDGLDGKDTLQWTLDILNNPPSITSVPETTAVENESYSYDIEADDEGAGPASYAGTVLPAWLNLNSSNGVLTGTPGDLDVGTHTVLINFNDGKGGTAVQSFTITVSNVNDAPVFSSIPDSLVLEDDEYRDTVIALDVDGDPLIYQLITSPAGMQIDSASGVITWTPDNADVGTLHDVVVKVSDPSLSEDWLSWQIRVINDPPEFLTTPNLITATEDSSFIFDLNADDEEAGLSLYSLIQAPEWLSIDPNTGILSGIPLNRHVGYDSIYVVFDDGHSSFDTLATQIMVINTPPIFVTVADTTIQEDDTLQINLESSDELESTVTYSFLHNPTSYLSLDDTSGLLRGVPRDGDVGTDSISVQVDDGNGDYDTLSFKVTVNNRKPQFLSTPIGEVYEDSLYTFDLETDDEEEGGGSYQFLTRPDWLSINEDSGQLTGIPLNVHVGDNQVSVIYTDLNGLSDTLDFDINVINSPPVITSLPPDTAREDQEYRFNVESSDEGSGNVTYGLIQSPDWLNLESNLTGILRGIPDNGDVTDGDSILVELFVADGNGERDTLSYYLKVLNEPPSILTPTTEFIVQEDSLFQVDIDCSDEDQGTILDYHFLSDTLTHPWLQLDEVSGLLRGVPDNRYVLDSLIIEIEVEDGHGGSDSRLYYLTVNNSIPVFSAIQDTVALEDEDFTLDINTGDEGQGETTYLFSGTIPDWISINDTTGLLTGRPGNEDVDTTLINVEFSDGNGATISTSFHLIVLNVNDQPFFVAPDTADTAYEDSAWYQQFLAADVDTIHGDSLKYYLLGAPEGVIIDSLAGLVSWLPVNEDVGVHHFSILVKDTSLAADTVNFTLTVFNVNDPPIILPDFPDTIYFTEDETTYVNLNRYVQDVDNDTLALNWQVLPLFPGGFDGVSMLEPRGLGLTSRGSPAINIRYSSKGLVLSSLEGDSIIIEIDSLNRMKLYATPDFFVDGLPFEAVVDDSTGQPEWGSDSVGFAITVIPENDAPVLDSLPLLSLPEDSAVFVPYNYFWSYVEDVDNPDSSLFFQLTDMEHLEVFISNSGFILKPDSNWFGQDTLQLIVSDTSLSDTTTWVIRYNSINDPPVINTIPDTTFLEDDTVIINLNDYIFDVENSDDELILKARVHLSPKVPPSTEINHEVLRNVQPGGTIPGNRASSVYFPDLSHPARIRRIGNSWRVKFSAGDSLVISIDSLTHQATIYGTLNFYTPPVTVTFFVYDDSLDVDSTSMEVEILPVNDAPRLSSLPLLSTQEDQSIQVRTVSWDSLITDVEDNNDLLSWSFSSGRYVTATYNGNEGLLVLIPEEDYFGQDTLMAYITDTGGLSDTAELIITVNPINDPPVIDTALFNLSFFQNESLEVDLDNFVMDVDNSKQELRWEISGGDTLIYSLNDTTHLLKIKSYPEWFGIDSLIAVVHDTSDSFDKEILYVTVVDTTPPDFRLKVFQNPLISQFMGVYVFPSERLKEPPLIVFDSDTAEVVKVSSDSVLKYYTTYSLNRNGLLQLFLRGIDLSSNLMEVEYNIGVSRILRETGGSIVDPGNILRFLIPPGGIKRDLYALTLPSGVGISSDTLFGKPVVTSGESKPISTAVELVLPVKELEDQARIIFNLASLEVDQLDAMNLGIYYQQDDEWQYVKTYTSLETGTYWAYHNKTGFYQIRASASHPAIIIPEKLNISQNYPNPFNNMNPFNPGTTIEYEIPAGEFSTEIEAIEKLQNHKVSLKIYNLLGQEVITLVNDWQPPGVYKVTWDGKNKNGKVVASGIYLYQFRVDNKVINRKMMVLR